IPLSRVSGGGEGSFGGDSVFTEETLAQNGTGASQNKPTSSVAAKGDSGVDPADDSSGQDQKSFAQIEDALSAMSGESMTANDMLRHIVTRVTDEGLIVELFDLPGEVLFQPRTDTPTPVMVELAEMISGIFALVGNQVAVNGFVRSEPIVLTRNPVWDLSSSRANRVRLLLQNTGFPSQRVQRVTGFADRVPAARNLMAARNNRIELILLRRPPGRNR
ncbi:chemotaxis protein MotB, partial [Rhodobacteraceae bacterium R_SAG10]|nr:chemotaxis protein MotB [Rhodobacteraceae bacterium R_SAG10]